MFWMNNRCFNVLTLTPKICELVSHIHAHGLLHFSSLCCHNWCVTKITSHSQCSKSCKYLETNLHRFGWFLPTQFTHTQCKHAHTHPSIYIFIYFLYIYTHVNVTAQYKLDIRLRAVYLSLVSVWTNLQSPSVLQGKFIIITGKYARQLATLACNCTFVSVTETSIELQLFRDSVLSWLFHITN